jgi:hypothetical protein
MAKRTNLGEKRNRQDLFSSSSNNNQTGTSSSSSSRRGKNNKSNNSNNNTASEAQKIQKSLLKTKHLLQNELHRVTNITNVIEEDGHILEKTMDEHKSLNTKKAQSALTSLERAQQHEQRVLNGSILFFILTVLYIIWCRVLIKLDFISIILDRIV